MNDTELVLDEIGDGIAEICDGFFYWCAIRHHALCCAEILNDRLVEISKTNYYENAELIDEAFDIIKTIQKLLGDRK